MKHFLFFILSMSFALGTFAQELKVKSCALASTDVTASTLENMRKDDVGNACALVKILLLDGISKVQGNVIGDIKEFSSEKWVYLSHGTKEIRVIPMHYKPIRVYFPDFGIDGVESKRTYVLDLVIQNDGAGSVVQKNQFLTIRYTPTSATVMVDSKLVRGNNGTARVSLPIGQHSYVVACDGYESEEGTMKLKASAPSNLQITLTRESVGAGIANQQRSVNQQPANTYVNSSSTSSNTSGYLSNSSSSLTSGGNTISIPVKNGINIEMVKVEAGTFMMGATSDEKDDSKNLAKPIHKVKLTKDYYIGKYEVTQALWQAVMGSITSPYNVDNLPIESVSWYDCQRFIRQLNKLTNREFRLPTEAEWEFAARGGVNCKSYRYIGSSNISDVAWTSENSDKKTHLVGTKLPNELGLYDMGGNVMEWCSDSDSPYSKSSPKNPKNEKFSMLAVARGGSFKHHASGCYSWSRYGLHDDRYDYVGFRLALSE